MNRNSPILDPNSDTHASHNDSASSSDRPSGQSDGMRSAQNRPMRPAINQSNKLTGRPTRIQSNTNTGDRPLSPRTPRSTDDRPSAQRNNGTPASSTAASKSGGKYTQSRVLLKAIPLGGLEELGANMMVYEFGDDIIVIDAGLTYPDDKTPGVDYIIPETKYLEDNKAKIRGLFLTNGHPGHIGALPYILTKIGDPVLYATPLVAAMVKRRLEEFGLGNRVKMNVIENTDTPITLGKIEVMPFRVNHNIPGSIGLSINTPYGQIIHTGSFKIDHTPTGNDQTIEFAKIASHGKDGVLALFSDSINALKPGYSPSEKEITGTIDKIFREAHGRIIFASYSSLVSRIQQIMDVAANNNRKVIVTGRSMVSILETALAAGFLKIEPKLIIKSEQAEQYTDDQIVILTTGAQGEDASQISRIAKGQHKSIKVKSGDTVVLSSSPIPGNDRSIVPILDSLTIQGANVIYNKQFDINTAGHAFQEELKLMMQLAKPQYFAPITGEHHMLSAHANQAHNIGITADRTFILENGFILAFNERGQSKILDEKVPAGYVFVDGLGVGDVGEVVIRDRQLMAQDGMFVIIASVDRTAKKLIGEIDVVTKGFIYMKSTAELIGEIKLAVRKIVADHIQSQEIDNKDINIIGLRQLIRDTITDLLYEKTQRKPMILPVVVEA